jgi:hypothetical protein
LVTTPTPADLPSCEAHQFREDALAHDAVGAGLVHLEEHALLAFEVEHRRRSEDQVRPLAGAPLSSRMRLRTPAKSVKSPAVANGVVPAVP